MNSLIHSRFSKHKSKGEKVPSQPMDNIYQDQHVGGTGSLLEHGP